MHVPSGSFVSSTVPMGDSSPTVSNETRLAIDLGARADGSPANPPNSIEGSDHGDLHDPCDRGPRECKRRMPADPCAAAQ